MKDSLGLIIVSSIIIIIIIYESYMY